MRMRKKLKEKGRNMGTKALVNTNTIIPEYSNTNPVIPALFAIEGLVALQTTK